MQITFRSSYPSYTLGTHQFHNNILTIKDPAEAERLKEVPGYGSAFWIDEAVTAENASKSAQQGDGTGTNPDASTGSGGDKPSTDTDGTADGEGDGAGEPAGGEAKGKSKDKSKKDKK